MHVYSIPLYSMHAARYATLMSGLKPYHYILSACAILIVVAGALLVKRGSSSTVASSRPLSWGGTGALLNPSYTPGAAAAPQSPLLVQNQPPYTYTLPSLSPQTQSSGGGAVNSFDFDAFISMLSQKDTTGASAVSEVSSSLSDAYAFVPGGLISTVEPQKRTVLQQSIYEYGNAAGSLISSFEQSHQNNAQLLTDAVRDRGNPAKAGAVDALARALSALGDQLFALDNVPSGMRDAHSAVAKDYQTLGQKLSETARAQSDASFLAAVQAYNTSADTFVKDYVALAQLFAAYGVSFSQGDAGNVFTFSPVSL